jgi:hypothetical protein
MTDTLTATADAPGGAALLAPARRKANGAAGPVKAKVAPGTRFGPRNTQGQDKALRVETEGGILPLVYNARRISLQERLDIADQIEAEDPEKPRVTWLTQWLSRILVSWEFYVNPEDPEDEQRYPTDAQSLMQLSDEFLAEVAAAIRNDISPPEPATSSGSIT